MQEKQNKEKHSTLDDSLIGLGMIGLTTGLMMNAIGGLNKMFGENNSIPKGVVKELMEGVMEGLMLHFQNQIYDLKYENKTLQEKVDELDTASRLQVEDLDRVNKELDELHVKNINLNKKNIDLIHELKKA